MPLSADIANGDQAVYTQYNNLRADALNLHALSSTDAVAISSGAITVTSTYSYYTLSAESGTADDLDTVTAGTGIALGDQVMLMATAGHIIKITTAGNIDRVAYLTEEHPAVLRYNGASWDVVKHSGCGWRMVWLPISAFIPTNTGGCGSVQELDGQKVRSFSASVDQSGVLALRFPSGWAGVLKCKVDWIVNDANAGDVVWVLSSENAAHGEVLGNAASVTFAASAAGGTQYEHTLTAISGELAAGADGELINLTLTRDQDHANETYATAAYAVGVMLYYLMYSDGIEEV